MRRWRRSCSSSRFRRARTSSNNDLRRVIPAKAGTRAGMTVGCDNPPMANLPLPLDDPPEPPLAERLRPKTIDEVIGQQHLLGPGKPLRAAFESGRLHSMILWGPPGTGKTTLARLMADAF